MPKKAPLTECPQCGFTAEKRAELTALLDHEHAAHTLGGSDGGSPRRLAPEARDRRITLGTEAQQWKTCPEAHGLHLDLMAAAQKEEADEDPDEAEVQAADDAPDADAASEAGGEVKKGRGRKARRGPLASATQELRDDANVLPQRPLLEPVHRD